MEDKPKVYFRADGNAQIGLGHIVRCLALAEMLSSDFRCHFIVQQPLPTLKEQILEVCDEIIELENSTISINEAQHIAKLISNDDIIVLDGYNFETAYQQELKKQGIKIVCIDDIHAYHFVADVIVNHAGGISSDQYSYEPYTRLFLGLPYALLRKPFREAAKNRIKNKPNKTFICLGGADPNNDILNVLKKIEETGEESLCYVVVGSAYLHQKELNKFLKNTKLKAKLLSSLSAEEVVFYMNKCSRAITSPSTVSYEYLSTGGLLYLKLTANNQQGINEYFVHEGLAFSFDRYGEIEKSISSNTFDKQNNLLDGYSETRFAEIFKSLNQEII
jgi:UDP-2,4-diacetamido-2,4,6-trideoxy-beta-L-altropyranose hydrolase